MQSTRNTHFNPNINSKLPQSPSYLNHMFDDDNNSLNFNVFRNDSVSPTRNDYNASNVSSIDSNPDDYMNQDPKTSRCKHFEKGTKALQSLDTNTMKRRRDWNNGVETGFAVKNYYKLNKKRKKKKKLYKLNMKEIGNNLKRIIKEQMQTKKTKKTIHDKDISIVEGPLNDYAKLANPKPGNLKMIKITRSTTNTFESYKRVQCVRDCNIGHQVVLINNLQAKHKYKYKSNLNTDILQVHGVVNQIHPDYITIIIPIDQKKQIQRKIYAFSLRDDDYGAVYIVNK